jgi:cysteinyl-tRNA synthetase, unknown class
MHRETSQSGGLKWLALVALIVAGLGVGVMAGLKVHAGRDGASSQTLAAQFTPAQPARSQPLPPPPVPQAAQRPPQPVPQKSTPQAQAPAAAPRVSAEAAEAERLRRINAAQSWGYQLLGSKLEDLQRSPYDLLVVDATTGLAAQRPFKRAETESLKRKADGSPRLVVSYLSVGESEDYRPEYFSKEYMEEDAPDWLMEENKDWKGNRLIKFCSDGWQKTILGDANGKSVYNSVDSSPLYRLMDLGFDGIYLDRVDVYEEVGKQCPNAEERMVDFVVKLAAHARKRNPYFMVILQNAEDLLKHPRMVKALDAVAKESLFHGWGGGDGSNTAQTNSADSIKWSTDRMNLMKKAGRPVFVVDYPGSRAKADISVRRIREQGYVPYIAPKALDVLNLPGRDF